MPSLVYLSRNDGTDMRISKECRSLAAMGFDVTFVGWEWLNVGEARPDPMPEIRKRVYRSRPGQSKARALPGFVAFARRVLREVRPDAIHAVNEELGGLAMPFKGRAFFVVDIFDSVVLVASGPGLKHRAIRRAALAVQKSADALIVTDEPRRERLGRFAAKAHVVPNYPVDPGPELAATTLPASPVRLLVAGSLGAGRGLEPCLALAERRDDVQIVAAGWAYDDLARDFLAHPRVEAHGLVTPAEALVLSAGCHAIMALYEPMNENNKMASPNKIYDALCVGREVVINAETGVSAWVAEQQTGRVVPYGDLDALSDAVDALPTEPAAFSATAARLRELFERGFSWSVAERALRGVYAPLLDA